MQFGPTKRPHFIALQAFLLLALSVPSKPTISSTVSNNIAVSATVNANCNLSSGTLPFGNYDPTGSNASSSLHTSGSVQIRCNKGTEATISLNTGNNGSAASGTSRAMRSASGTSVLNYEVYTDSSYSTIWNSSHPVPFTASNSAPSSISLYGKIPADQDVENGVYTDTMIITANF